MRIATSLALAGLAAMFLPLSAAAAEVKVNFIGPERYVDAGLYRYGAKAKEQTFHEIERELQRLATRYLTADETLTIDILDIDLAGRFEPWETPGYDIRFMRDITWPRIKVRYALAGGARPMSGEENLSDPMYLMAPSPAYSGEPLRYEKAMLERWFRLRFAGRRVS